MLGLVTPPGICRFSGGVGSFDRMLFVSLQASENPFIFNKIAKLKHLSGPLPLFGGDF